MKIPSNKIKKNKLRYVRLFIDYLKSEITDTNMGPYLRYTLYRDKILPIYKMKLKTRKRKGRKQ